MKKLLPLFLSLLLLLSACGPAAPQTSDGEDSGTTTVVATTYPVYLLAGSVLKDTQGITLKLMIDQPVSCLHDYTLSVTDMQLLEKADAILLSGAGLEDSMASALRSAKNAAQIDCSQGIPLLPMAESGHSSDDGHNHANDPHIWLDPNRACQMLDNIAKGLAQLDESQADRFQANAQAAAQEITTAYQEIKTSLEGLSCRELVTFHDGFSYFAEAFDLTVLHAIEEEAGSEASAQEVAAILEDMKSHQIPAVFTEVNGSDATAQLISRETGAKVATLDLLMSGTTENPSVSLYIDGLRRNADTILEAYA